MTPEMLDLARRAVACPKWRWMPGMLRVWPFVDRTPIQQSVLSCFASDEDRARGYIERMPIERVDDHPLSIEPMERWNDAADQWVTDIPDLIDAATLGCLLALVREAWDGDFEKVWLEWYPPLSRWGIQGAHAGARSILLASGPTEAEALVAALEAAP